MRWTLTWLVVLLAFGTISGPASVLATTLSVPGDYPTIQDAVDAASPGDTIVVGLGKYAGAVVTKDNLTIIGTLGILQRTVIVDGPMTHPASGSSPELRAGFLFPGGGVGSGSTISRFIFQCGEVPSGGALLAFGVFSRGANSVTVTRNVIRESIQGITNWHGSNWTIEQNLVSRARTLSGGGIGILVGSYNGTHANGNLIHQNAVAGAPQADGNYSTPAIALISDTRISPGSGGPVRDNQVASNTCESIGRTGSGIDLSDLSGGDVTGNTIFYNESYICVWGITVHGASGNTIQENRLVYTREDGIWAGFSRNGLGANGNLFSSNRVFGSWGHGIFMDVGSSNNMIYGNSARHSRICDLRDSGVGNDWQDNEYDTTCGGLVGKRQRKSLDPRTVPGSDRALGVPAPYD